MDPMAIDTEIDRNPPSSRDRSIQPMISAARVSARRPIALTKNAFEVGDMVWGKVKSHPWWPGVIFQESFAAPSVRRTKTDGSLLVAFFGDSSYGWFDPSELLPFAPTFAAKSKQAAPTRSFLNAVEEAVDEVRRRAALGLSCRCRNPRNFRLTKVPDCYEIDVVGYERNGIYSGKQIDRAREEFEGESVLGFIKMLAVTPRGSSEVVESVRWHQGVAVGMALRAARFEEFDETYAQAFGVVPVRPAKDENGVVLEQAESFAPRGRWVVF